jgi:hypothetical protein
MLYRSPTNLPIRFSNPSVFIAGGISDCPDWQSEMVSLINTDIHDVVNPRREGGFDRTGTTAEEQITWEHRALEMVDACIFWFPKETLCPITLFELGKMLERTMETSGMRLAVGWHPDYARAFDLEVQIKLASTMPYRILHAASGWDELCGVIKTTWS